MLAAKVFAAGITHLTDARYFAAWDVDYLAFPLGEDLPAAIGWEQFAVLREWVEGPTIVAELGERSDVTQWAETLLAAGVNIALLPATAPAAAPQILHAAGIQVFVHQPVAGYESADDVHENLRQHPTAASVILDFEAGGITWQDLAAGHPFGLPELREILAQRPCYLQIDLGKNDPQTIVREYAPAGLAVRGSSEEKVGYKSFDDLDGLFEGLEIFE